MLKRRGKVRNGSIFHKILCMLSCHRPLLPYLFLQIGGQKQSCYLFPLRNWNAYICESMLQLVPLLQYSHFQYLCKQGCSILVELHKNSNWFNIRSMFSSKPLYPIGGTMSCSLRRCMVCYSFLYCHQIVILVVCMLIYWQGGPTLEVQDMIQWLDAQFRLYRFHLFHHCKQSDLNFCGTAQVNSIVTACSAI